jgi:uncharacterized membrane protein
MIKNFVKYLAQGLLVTVPLAITLIIFYRLFSWAYLLLQRFELNVHPYLDPLLIGIFILVILSFIGWFASSILLKPLFNFLGRTIEHLPVIKHIYSPIKDFLEAFVGNKKRFTKPVLILTNPAAGIEEMGFITQEDLEYLGIKNKVAVYLPHSYASSGKLVIVPKEHIKPLDIKGGDAMKFIVTGGVTDIHEEE